jgi:hypothetical protein
LFSVASRTIRKAFWLPSRRVHLCASKAEWISTSVFAVNCELQRSHTPSRDGLVLTMRSLRFAMTQVYRFRGERIRPVDFKRHHYPIPGTLTYPDYNEGETAGGSPAAVNERSPVLAASALGTPNFRAPDE